jgi:hypothetical protein
MYTVYLSLENANFSHCFITLSSYVQISPLPHPLPHPHHRERLSSCHISIITQSMITRSGRWYIQPVLHQYVHSYMYRMTGDQRIQLSLSTDLCHWWWYTDRSRIMTRRYSELSPEVYSRWYASRELSDIR